MNVQKLVAFFLSVLLLSMLCQTAQTQTTSHASGEDARVARLIGLAKVWGTVKYFHLYLAYREIDWDKALVEAIPKVNAARAPQEYQAAVNQMLAALSDKITRAEIETEVKAAASKTAASSNEKLFGFQPPVIITHVENQAVVTKVLDDKASAKVGDIVLAIDGAPVEKRDANCCRVTLPDQHRRR
jgi:C-terminal processing protease CtpA/Prc